MRGPTRSEDWLEVKEISRHFGGILALNRVSFQLEQGGITSLIGPNGAGKTTLINVISGLYPADQGRIHFQGENIVGLAAHSLAARGIGRTFQLEELFGSLTVLENVMVGCHVRSRSGMVSCGLALPSARREEKQEREAALGNLQLIGLEHKAGDSIARLPLGERKLVGVARALSMKPRFLMLDEPVGGLAAHEIAKLVDLIYRLRSEGLTIFIVEHNMPFVMSLSEKVLVLDGGSLIAEGLPEEIRRNEAVIKAYLGEEVAGA
ncbi:MAG TPA: ABC transporter ATP-binding protein [Thermodesulfobacteriota bacterium]|nr:ABC transporter ATP-binding protein [Thermodesulfobacteriota bacterium]